ncbi:hypothetical protein EC957_001349 [Mortierella hygrophila]|uniref:F-box domain-containing protein n=1 Tax=Mortierella hygrophila TaxID=979708 RepID=A0A9P6F6Q6_9FUNG|nr:hypothetical protein EC957_001349 [Mortierella hygrophila]
MQTALDLPEIRSTVASHLHSTSPHSLLSCMLVSKTWYDSFHPFRWKTVHLYGVHSVKANVTLRRHAAHVRELGFLGVESLKHFSDIELYSRVRRMRVFGAGEEGRVVWEKLAGLVGAGGGGRLRWLSVEDSVPLPVFLVALGGGYGKRKEDRLRLSEQQQRQQEYESEDSEESEEEDESGQGRQGGESGVGTLPATAVTSTTSVNTTIDSVATTLTPLSSFSSSTTTRSGRERRLDTLVWKRVRIPAANMDHLWRASRGTTNLVLECLTITGMQQAGSTSTTLPTGPTLVLTEHGATYPLRPLITNPPLPSTEIQELRVSWILGLSVEWQLELWIRPCRELRSLVWEAPSFPDPLLLQFVRCIEDGTWAWLTSLEISACVAPFPSDAAIARILSASSSSSFYSSSSSYECSSYPPSPPRSTSSNSSSSSSSYSFDSHRSSNESTRRPHHRQNHVQLHRWERLIFRTAGFGPLAFEALRRHFGTLKTVKWIGYAGSVTNDMARKVLEGCPLLEEFHAPFLWMDDFVGSQGRIEQAGEGQEQEKKDGGVDQGQGTLSYFSAATAGPLPSPPLSPTPTPALIPDQQRQQQQQQLQLKPWPCEGLKSLFISATSPNFFAPPLSKPEEEVVRTRLATMKELTYYCVGSTIFSTNFRHEY